MMDKSSCDPLLAPSQNVPVASDVDCDTMPSTSSWEGIREMTNVIDSESNTSQLESVFGTMPLAPSLVPMCPSVAVCTQVKQDTGTLASYVHNLK